MEKKKDKDAIKQFQELLQEYGDIQFFDDEIDKEALGKYRKATSQEIGMLSQLFGCLPSAATGYTKDVMMNKAFNEAVKGTFRIVIPEGMHLANSRTTPGALKTLLMSAENHSKGPADAFINDAVLNLSKMPDFVNAAFSLASFFTGQYFMSQINDKMSDVHHELDKILGFLEDEKVSEIYAAVDELTELTAKLSHVRESSEKIVTGVNSARNLQEIARKNMVFYSRQVEKSLNSLKVDNKDDYNKIVKRIKEIYSFLNHYELCLNMFCQAKILEVATLPMSNEEAVLYKQDITKAVEKYPVILEKVKDSMALYIKDAFYKRQKKEIAKDIGALGGSVVCLFIAGGSGISKDIINMAKDSDRENKERRRSIEENNKREMDEKKAMMEFFSSYGNKIDDWIAMRSKAIDIVYSDGEYYIKAPITETDDQNQLEVAQQEN